MTKEISFPPLHDLSPSELGIRKQHLLNEITRERAPHRLAGFLFPSWLGTGRRAGLIAALGAAALIAGSSALAAVMIGTDQAPLRFSPHQGTTPSLGTDASSIISAVKARVPNVVSLVLKEDPIANGSGSGTFNALVAHAVIAESAPGGAGVAQAMWAGNLIGGALKTAFLQAGLSPPDSVDVTLLRPDGTTDHIGGGIGNVVPDQVFNPVTSAIQDHVRQNAAAEGMSNVQVLTLPVVNDVLEITASTTDDPATAARRFFNAGGLDGLLGQSSNNFEGVLFQLNDAQGTPLLISAAAPRAGGGSFWAASSTGISGDELHR